MRKGYARITAGLLMLSLAIGAMGCPVAARAEEDPIPGILNLDESIECAMKNDENLRLLEDNIDLMEDALEEATEVYWDYEGGKISGDSWSNLERAKINNRYYVIQAQADHDQAVAAYKDEKNRISYEATRHFYALLLAQKNVESAVKALDDAREDLELVKLKFELGDATPLDVTSASNYLLQAENDVKTKQETLQLNEMQWKLFLGLPHDQEIQIEGDWEDLELPDIDNLVDEDVFAELVEADASVVQAKNDYVLQNISHETFRDIYLTVNKNYDKYLYQFEQAAYRYDQSVNQAWLNVYSAYFSLLQQERVLVESETELFYAKALRDLEELKYSLGESSLDSLLETQDKVYEAVVQNNRQKVDFMLNALSWQKEYR